MTPATLAVAGGRSLSPYRAPSSISSDTFTKR